MLTVETIQGFADSIADIAAIDPTPILRVEMGEMGDGSCRYFALVNTYDAVNEHEQDYRVCSPVPWNAPAWACDLTEWTVEVRVGDGWMDVTPSVDGCEVASC